LRRRTGCATCSIDPRVWPPWRPRFPRRPATAPSGAPTLPWRCVGVGPWRAFFRSMEPMFRKIKGIHFVGIGGSGMSGIAEILLTSGYKFSVSHVKPSATTDRLKEMGAQIAIVHDAKNIFGVEVVVVSSAIRRDIPELIAAQYRGIPIIPRAEMLAEL